MPNMPGMIIAEDEYRKLAQLLLDKLDFIPVFGEFNSKLEEIVIECILKAKADGKKGVTFLINSGGGANRVFSSIKAAMLLSGLEFRGIVMGTAASNAFNLLQQCKTRAAVRDAILMFHWGSNGFNNSELSALIEGKTWPVEHLIQEEMITAQQVSERTGVPVDTLKEYALYERSFQGQQAKDANFVDEIILDLPRQVSETLKVK